MRTKEEVKEGVSKRLMQAVGTMRDACDQAERAATEGDGEAARRVLHSLMWGMANASTSIEAASSFLDDFREMQLASLKEAGIVAPGEKS